MSIFSFFKLVQRFITPMDGWLADDQGQVLP